MKSNMNSKLKVFGKHKTKDNQTHNNAQFATKLEMGILNKVFLRKLVKKEIKINIFRISNHFKMNYKKY